MLVCNVREEPKWPAGEVKTRPVSYEVAGQIWKVKQELRHHHLRDQLLPDSDRNEIVKGQCVA